MRSTNQDEGMKFIFEKKEMTDFGIKQVDLFFEAISKIKSETVLNFQPAMAELLSQSEKLTNDYNHSTTAVKI
jgi:hypothetical protein